MPFTEETAKKAGAKSTRSGVPNKTTSEIRDAFQKLVECKLPEMETWISRLAEKDPGKALDVLIRLGDFIIPKLQRVEMSGEMTLQQILTMSPEERKSKIIELRRQLEEGKTEKYTA